MITPATNNALDLPKGNSVRLIIGELVSNPACATNLQSEASRRLESGRCSPDGSRLVGRIAKIAPRSLAVQLTQQPCHRNSKSRPAGLLLRHSAAACAGDVKPVESRPTLSPHGWHGYSRQRPVSVICHDYVGNPLCSTPPVPHTHPNPVSSLSSKHPVKQQIQPIVPSSLPLTRISQADAPSQTIKPQAFSTQGSAYADNTPDATVKHITLPSRMPHASHRSPA